MLTCCRLFICSLCSVNLRITTMSSDLYIKNVLSIFVCHPHFEQGKMRKSFWSGTSTNDIIIKRNLYHTMRRTQDWRLLYVRNRYLFLYRIFPRRCNDVWENWSTITLYGRSLAVNLISLLYPSTDLGEWQIHLNLYLAMKTKCRKIHFSYFGLLESVVTVL